MFLLPSTLLFLTAVLVDAGSVAKGGACNPGDSRLQTGTYQFWTDCDSVTYCAANNTCVLKGCRRDIFPFGYSQDNQHLPNRCPAGQFCPDEEDACQALLPVGSPCQLNRDDECQPPPNYLELADTLGRGLNFNGSVCLNAKCMWANVTVGQPCVVENTPYIGYTTGGEFINIVSRDNCKTGSYCDTTKQVCMQTKDLNAACGGDKECTSYNCLSSGVCGKDADTPNTYPTWIYVILVIAMFGGMFGTLFGMFYLHGKQRDTEREKRVQYWREQNAFRQNIIQMRETANASLLNLPRTGSPGGSIYTDDSHAPLVNHSSVDGHKGMHMRDHYDGDDTVFDDDGMSVQINDYKPGRF